MKTLMATTQSKCIPYAKDRHRLANTNAALATKGGNAEMLQQRRKRTYSPPSAVQLPVTRGSLCSPRPGAARNDSCGTVTRGCYSRFLPIYLDSGEKVGARPGSPDPSATSSAGGRAFPLRPAPSSTGGGKKTQPRAISISAGHSPPP